MSTKIYVIRHCTSETSNAFYMNREDAEEAIKKNIENFRDVCCTNKWFIIELEEGKEFEGSFLDEETIAEYEDENEEY